MVAKVYKAQPDQRVGRLAQLAQLVRLVRLVLLALQVRLALLGQLAPHCNQVQYRQHGHLRTQTIQH
jgi:hypothetical protein